MIVDESSAKSMLSRYGLNVPDGGVARSLDVAREIYDRINGPVVVKAMIPAGGRGKAGGVRRCERETQMEDAVSGLLGTCLLDQPVTAVRIEAAMDIYRELYAAVMVDTESGMLRLMFGVSGGVEVESQTGPVITINVAPGADLPVHRILPVLSRVADPDVDMKKLAQVLTALFRAATDNDALLLEVNPLAVLTDGSLAILDCKLLIDDNSLARHPVYKTMQYDALSESERLATDIGVAYVPLDGDIAVIASGAGLGMATLDMLALKGLRAANFLDTGGGISEEMIRDALTLTMSPAGIRGAIINLYGGINSMMAAARGIVAACHRLPGNRPIVVKILGNQQEEAWDLLSKETDVQIIKLAQTEAAVIRLASLLK